ncbi:MAG TPA: HDOD domain-containing protein [Kofleriaceae bacterium]
MTAALAKKRVLFVDDDAAILSGLNHLLFRERKRWDLVFANGGEEALAELRRGAFDVVVSDMRMPGMDGAALLATIRNEFPSVVRVMLTGYAEREALARALPVIHQLLNKPCSGKTLRGALERSMSLGSLEGDATLKPLIGGLDKLPSPPALYRQVAAALSSPDTALVDVASLVGSDPAMCAKVLQLVNNACFDEVTPTCSIEDALELLGTEQLGYVAMTASVFGSLDDARGESVDAIQEASLRCARLAERFVDGPGRTDVFVAALLHDVGRLVLSLASGERCMLVGERVAAGAARCDAEREAFGVTHAEVGACLLAIWGIPGSIVDLVRCHHDPAAAAEPLRTYAAAVHVADALTVGRDPDLASLERAGMLDRLDEWRRVAASWT